MSQTPPWAKRIEKEIINCKRQLEDIKKIQGASIIPCHFHERFGDTADRCNKGLCPYYLAKIGIELSQSNTSSIENSSPIENLSAIENSPSSENSSSLSPIVSSILAYMKPVKFISPIKDLSIKRSKLNCKEFIKKKELTEEIVPISISKNSES